MRCAACHTDNTIRDGGFWSCSCGWVCPILTSNDTGQSIAEKLDLAMQTLRDRGMPVTHIRLGLTARNLWAQWYREQPQETVQLETGEAYGRHSIRHRGIVVTSHVTSMSEVGGRAIPSSGGDDFFCLLGVNQPRPLAPRWLGSGMTITHTQTGEIRTVESIDGRRGIVSTTSGTMTFEELRANWREHRELTVRVGQIWNERSGDERVRIVPWRVSRVGSVTAHLIASTTRIVPLEDLLGLNRPALYDLIHDVAQSNVPAPPPAPPRNPVAPQYRPRAPKIPDAYDVLDADPFDDG